MADGFICANCGHYEADHLTDHLGESYKKGYRKSLRQCGFGFQVRKCDEVAAKAAEEKAIPSGEELDEY